MSVNRFGTVKRMSRPFVTAVITTLLVGSGLASCSSSGKSIDTGPVDTGVDSSNPESATTVSPEPCAPSHLAAELDVASLELVDDLCDGSWAVVDTEAASASGLALAHDVDGVWTFAVTMPAESLCRDDLNSRGVPTEMVDALEWPCDTFALVSKLKAEDVPYAFEPEEWRALRLDERPSGSFKAGVEGGRVVALQREFVRQGLLTEADVDGEFGPTTRRAVLDYQLAHEIPLTGEADDATLRSLRMLPTERAAAHEIVVSGDNLGDMEYGTEADTVVAYLTDLLGPADWEGTYPPEDQCRGVASLWMTWSGLTVYFDDFLSQVQSPPLLGLRFRAFSYRAQPELGVVTMAGARIGDPLSRWLELNPGSSTEVLVDHVVDSFSQTNHVHPYPRVLWMGHTEFYGDPNLLGLLATTDGTDGPVTITTGHFGVCDWTGA